MIMLNVYADVYVNVYVKLNTSKELVGIFLAMTRAVFALARSA